VSGTRRLRLGTRLALGLGALALVVFAVVGTVMATSMRGYLTRKLDDQIQQNQAMQEKDIAKYGDVKKSTYGWYSAVYTIENGEAKPKSLSDLPQAAQDLADVAEAVSGHTAVWRTVYLRGDGVYRVRACPTQANLVLVSAAPTGELDSTVNQLVLVEIATFLAALIAFVVIGRAVLRRGLQPLSDMADTAHDITSHDLTDSGRLPVRADSTGGGVEVEELRTAFNTMLDHIDASLTARTAAEQRLRRFIADASHELRTPLTSLRGYADLFRYAAANEPAEREAHLAKMRAEAARMSVLLDDLLLLARLDSAEVEAPLRVADTNLVELAEAAADAFRATQPDHPLTLRAGPDPVPLRADPMRLRQVLDNLLTNVAVHTPVGTAVELEVIAEPGQVVLRVTDSGPGIPQADQARIFDRFYRVDGSRTRDRGGSGLGLAVVSSLVAAHGGTVELTSEPGRTTFTVRLPV
jgi:two-component system OmpR family sensor kinase